MANEKSLSAELLVEFGFRAYRRTFVATVSDRDGALRKPVMLAPLYVWSWWYDQNYADDFKDVNVLVETDNGEQIIRLYAPIDTPVEVVATELPQEIVSVPWNPLFGPITAKVKDYIQRVNASNEGRSGAVFIIGKTPAKAIPPAVEYLGVAEEQVVDSLEFNGERFVSLRHNYVTNCNLLYTTQFRGKTGVLIDPPNFIPGYGMLGLAEDGYGGVVVEYPVKYRLFKVRYSLPTGLVYPELQKAWLQGDISKVQMPPVMVIALADDYVTTTSFERDVYPKGAYLGSWAYAQPKDEPQTLPDLYSELSRETVDKRVYNPADPNQYVDIRIPTKMQFNQESTNVKQGTGYMKITRSDGKVVNPYLQAAPDSEAGKQKPLTMTFTDQV